MKNSPLSTNISTDIKTLLTQARKKVVQSVNTTMVYTYFEIGRVIVEHGQQGKERAEYGKETLKQVSKELTREFGRGFSVTNLKQMKSFFLIYSKGQTASDQLKNTIILFQNKFNESSVTNKKFGLAPNKILKHLSFSHIVELIKIDDSHKRAFYELECAKRVGRFVN